MDINARHTGDIWGWNLRLKTIKTWSLACRLTARKGASFWCALGNNGIGLKFAFCVKKALMQENRFPWFRTKKRPVQLTISSICYPLSTIVYQRAWELASVSQGGKVFVDPDAQSLEPLLEKPSRAAITSFLQLGLQHAYHDPTMPSQGWSNSAVVTLWHIWRVWHRLTSMCRCRKNHWL